MIESRYWRAELKCELIWLKRHRTYRRWTEKQHVLFERKLMLTAFQIRSLLERPKVNDKARHTTMPVLRYKKSGDRPFTSVGPGHVHERFNLDCPEREDMSALDVCNQLIHYYWMQTFVESKTFTSILIFSDYKRHKCAFKIQVSDLLKLFSVFAADQSAVTSSTTEWNEIKQDFVITKSFGPEKRFG